MKILKLILIITALFIVVSCRYTENNAEENEEQDNNNTAIPSGLLQEGDFEYTGAFKLPHGPSDIKSFNWGGHSMTFYPRGDPDGEDDGHPGSLYITGHAWEHQVAEVSIPKSLNSGNKNPEELNTAKFLQPFHNIMSVQNLEIPRTGLAFLVKQGTQTSDKLHFCWGYHMQEDPPDLTHGWCELDLSNPRIKKGWFLAGHPVYIQNMSTNDYMFEIPAAWAVKYTPGQSLASGRFRDGGWSGQGPALFAIGPWNHGNPPPDGTGIQNTTLLLYTSTRVQEGGNTLNNYHHSDEWTGAAWLTAENKAAVIFAGTKGFGDCWYGNQNGPCLECEDRGWWSDEFKGLILLYNPADLAEVAEGRKKPYQPQPYAAMEIDKYLFNIYSKQQKYHTGACAFDRSSGLLYMVEYRADGDKCLIHVFKIKG